MDIGSIFLVLALLVVVAVFVSRPLFENRVTASSPAVNQMEHKHSTLLAERDRTINALYELDFDNALGKIPAEEYHLQRAKLLEQGVDILRQIDALQDAGEERESDAQARIEAALASRSASAAIPEATLPHVHRSPDQRETKNGPNQLTLTMNWKSYSPTAGVQSRVNQPDSVPNAAFLCRNPINSVPNAVSGWLNAAHLSDKKDIIMNASLVIPL